MILISMYDDDKHKVWLWLIGDCGDYGGHDNPDNDYGQNYWDDENITFQSLIVAYRCKLELWDDDKVTGESMVLNNCNV